MPAFTLSQQPRDASSYDVIGEYSASSRRFVRHVALYNADDGAVRIRNGEDVDVVHMGPPLDRAGKAKAHVVGTVPLTNEEIREIEVWIVGIDDEYNHASVGLRQQYHIHPPWKDKLDPNTGVRRYSRYSCAGFVLKAYSEVDIDLLAIDEESLPKVDMQTLRLAYPQQPLNHNILASFGVEGDEPWGIVLAGYVLHALNRTADRIRQEPYRAREGDEQF